MQIDPALVERIVRTLHVAVLEQDALGSGQRAEVEPRLEADVLRIDAVAVAEGDLRLRDGGILRLAAEFGTPGIDEVDVAVVAHRQVFDHQVVAPEIKHREISHRPLGLSAGGSQDHVVRIVRHAEQLKRFAADHHPERRAAADGTADLSVIRIVHPIHPGSDIYAHRLLPGSVLDVRHRFVETVEDIGRGRLRSRQAAVDIQRPRPKGHLRALVVDGLRLEAQGTDQHQQRWEHFFHY